jgi:hypothetical protein
MVMASTTVSAAPDIRATQHSITVEPVTITGHPDVRVGVVERLNERLVNVCCNNTQLADGEDIEEVARRYARRYDAVYVPPVAGEQLPELSGDEGAASNEANEARARLVASLRELASFLAAHPEVPVPEYEVTLGFAVSVDGGDEAAIERVRAAAAALGVEAVEYSPGYWRAERTFGQVSYGCGYIARRIWAEAQATRSYEGAVVPDGSSS